MGAMKNYDLDPYKLLVLGTIGFSSLNSLFRFKSSASAIVQAFPHPWGHVMLAGIVMNCVMSLYGVIRQHTVRGVLWERAGQIGLIGLFLAYGVWGFFIFGERATQFASILIALCLAAAVRVWQIERRRRRAVSHVDP